MSQKPAAEAPQDKLVDATVRRGTVVHGDGIHSGPGETVKVTEREAGKLRQVGILDDPNGPPAVSIGPTFDAEDGPAVNEN